MKKISKKISTLIISFSLGISLFSVDAFASSPSTELIKPNVQVMEVTQSEQQIQPYSDIIDWRYKSENGKMYRRQYNYSKQEWIGEWELC